MRAETERRSAGIEQIPVRTMGKPHDVVDGLGAFFHEGHFPEGGTLYRRASKPG